MSRISFTNVGSRKRLLFRFPLLLRGYSRFQRNHYYSATATSTATATTTTALFDTYIRRSFSSTSTMSTSTSTSTKSKPTSNSATTKTFRWLDLEGSGLSMLERLSLEEALLRNTQDNWIIVGRHTVWPNKHITTTIDDDIENKMKNLSLQNKNKNRNKIQQKTLPEYITACSNDKHGSNDDDGQYGQKGQHPNPNGMIVMGIGGKPQNLLNIKNVIDDKLLVVKRFSGGGTVVMDENAIWTTIIAGRRKPKPKHDHHDDDDDDDEVFCKPYPRSIMEWTAKAVYGPTFERMNEKLISSSSSETTALPKFSLREDDYVLNGTKKMGGNAQAITGRQGWLHHTSFLWDYKDINMERYLKLPEKRPEYRSNRTHKDFLVKLKDYYGKDHDYRIFLDSMKEACEEGGLIEMDWSTVYREVFCNDNNDETDSKDGMESWWLENRTRILHDL
jgi:lipoate-protein ligase A